MSHSTRSIPVSGAFVVNAAQRNLDLLQIAKELETLAKGVSDQPLRNALAKEINRLLDVAEQSGSEVRYVVHNPGWPGQGQ